LILIYFQKNKRIVSRLGIIIIFYLNTDSYFVNNDLSFSKSNFKEIRMSKTLENLKEAFAGESQANRKYLAFAEKAESEGKPGVAKLFRAAAAAETIHAHAHLRLMKGIGSTEDNLKAAIEGETFEFNSMYPAMMEDAKAEGENAVLRYFGFANEAEKIHAKLYTAALEDEGDTFADAEFYICSVCGHTRDGEPSDKCPICGAAPKAYKKVD